MAFNPYATYVENSALSATPLEGVCMLYEAAVDAVRDARRQLASRDIRARARSISRAVEILAELSASLDHAKGGEISVRLAALYDYIQRRLLEANAEQSDAPMAEAIQLLETLLGAWKAVPAAGDRSAPTMTEAELVA